MAGYRQVPGVRPPTSECCVVNSNQTEDERKAVFIALVETQDKGAGVADSRKLVAEQFGLTVEQVQDVEKEGLAQNWLDEAS